MTYIIWKCELEEQILTLNSFWLSGGMKSLLIRNVNEEILEEGSRRGIR